MHFTHPLYLASKSVTRQELLKQARIPFMLLNQTAQEVLENPSVCATEIVPLIARQKMDHTELPQATNGTIIYVLTADTMCVDSKGKTHGKPRSKEEAREMLLLWRKGCTVITAFCLDKKLYVSDTWTTSERIEKHQVTDIHFSIEDAWVHDYLSHSMAMGAAGAMVIEGYGAQFVQSISGSYSNILGLPLYELRQALSTLGFYRLTA